MLSKWRLVKKNCLEYFWSRKNRSRWNNIGQISGVHFFMSVNKWNYIMAILRSGLAPLKERTALCFFRLGQYASWLDITKPNLAHISFINTLFRALDWVSFVYHSVEYIWLRAHATLVQLWVVTGAAIIFIWSARIIRSMPND
jgi:hypothetical protein